MSVYLHDVTTALGSRTEHNDSATLGQPEADCERIVSKTGVLSRPIADADQFTSDLATSAVRRLLETNDIAPKEVGHLIVCTQTPDHLIPGVSSYLHGKLGLSTDCFVLDINQGCSGFVLGTQTISALLQASHSERPAILINADTYSRLIRPDDLATRVLFGDAATASLLSTVPRGLRVAYCRSYADGTGYDSFVARGSGLRDDGHNRPGICMDGPGILNFALRAAPEAVRNALEDNGLGLQQIRMILFHQANSFVIRQLSRKMKLAQEQVPENCAQLGNTVSASIPLLLKEQLPNLVPGDRVLAVGFGVGLSWGATLLEKQA